MSLSSSAAKPKYLTEPRSIETMPPGIPFIVGNEAAERFSYYGMGAILAVFLTGHLLDASGQAAPMDEPTANEWQHNFFAAVYAMPILGAILSDWVLGKYRTILSLSLAYCLGHAVMATVDIPELTGISPRVTLLIAFALIAIGAGGIKPCVTAHVGDQFGPRNKHLMPKVYGWFYFCINFGATFSKILTPWLLRRFGPALAFGVPGILMGIATLVFWLGRKRYVHVPAGGTAFIKESFSSDGLRAILNLAPLYLLLSPFWSLFDQTHSSWVHQAKKMDLTALGHTFDPSEMQALNPILVMLFVPLFTYVIYPLLGKRIELTALRKIGCGLFLTVPSFAVIALAQERIDAGYAPTIWWQVAGYVIITAAEILVSITAIEFSYTQAPRKMKSLIMGVFFLSFALGNVFTAQVNKYIAAEKAAGNVVLEGASYFWFFTWIMLGTAVVFAIYAQFYRGQTFFQGEE